MVGLGGLHSPQGPGVLEANANLDDAIKGLAQAPQYFEAEQNRQELVRMYKVAGSGAASTVLERCMRIMRDPNEVLDAKVMAVRVVDLLMAEDDDHLARMVVGQLKFFTGIAKRSKEKERKKRRPAGMFSSRTSDSEVAVFVAVVSELLDKWGRIYEETPHKADLQEIAKARNDLLKERVSLPMPELYRHLAKASPSGSPSFSKGNNHPRGLDESHLSQLAEDFQGAMGRHGPEATETVEAHSRFEAEMDQWRRATQEAAEQEDFAGFERLSEVTFRFAELGSRLESSASASASGASTPATSPAPPAPRLAQEEAAFKHKKRHHSRSQKSQSGGGGMEGAGNFPEASQTSFGGTFGGSFSEFGGGTGFDFGGAAGAAGLGGPGFELGSAAAGFGGPPPDHPGGGFPQPGAGPPPGPNSKPSGRMSRRRSSGSLAEEPPPAAVPPEVRGPEGPNEREAALLQANAQLQTQVQALQAQNQTLQAQLELRFSEGGTGGSPEQLRAALRRVRELEPLRVELSDARATSGSLRELSQQLQGELDQCRRELRQAVQRAETAEEWLAEREELISETRQRLFDAKQRSAQLEDEMKSHEEVHRSLQGRLQSARADHTITELELRQLRHAVSSAGGLFLPPERPRGNQSYSRDGDTAGTIRGARTVASLPPSVNQSDELAGSATNTLGGLAEMGGAPLKQLTRRQAAGVGDSQASFGQEPAPTIPRSAPDVWRSTPRIARPPGAIVMQTPPASHACLEHTNANFQKLLALPRGSLFEDQGILMEMSIAVVGASGSGRLCLDFEITVRNRGGHMLHDVQLRPSDSGARYSACQLHIEPEPARPSAEGGGAAPRGGTPWWQQQHRFRGRLEVLGPFETGPQVDFSYLLPDNLSLRARLRLPLAISRFMSAKTLEAPRIAELWAEPEFAHSEVAVVCTVRGTLLGAGAPFSVWKCMELGGVFRCFPGLDENPRGAVFASSYPQRHGQASEVLVRAELGAPSQTDGPMRGAPLPLTEAAACRVAVRSASHQVNRALAQVFLDILCDAPESTAAA